MLSARNRSALEAQAASYGDLLRAMRTAARGTWLITLDYPMPRDASLVFGLVAMTVGVLVATQLSWWQMSPPPHLM